MDEWVDDGGRPVPITHPLSFARADMEMCFDRIRPELRMPDDAPALPHRRSGGLLAGPTTQIRCAVMQGGQGEVKHWAFNDPPKREGSWQDAPPPPAEYRKLTTRVTDLHPMTMIQNAAHLRRRAGGAGAHPGGHGRAGRDVEGRKSLDLAGRLPRQSVRHAADDADDRQEDSRLRVPMSLLADHPNVQFNFYRPGIGVVAAEMH